MIYFHSHKVCADVIQTAGGLLDLNVMLTALIIGSYVQMVAATGFEPSTGRVFIYELSGCGFKSRCNYLNVIYQACFKQRVL